MVRQTEPIDFEFYPEVIADVGNLVSDLLMERGFTKASARPIASAVTGRLIDHWGGQIIYVPKAVKLTRDRRNAQIRREFNGHNLAGLCRKYDLTIQRLRQILNEGRS